MLDNPGFSVQELIDRKQIDLTDSNYLNLSGLTIDNLEGLKNIPNPETRLHIDLNDNLFKTIEKTVLDRFNNLQKLTMNANYELSTIELGALSNLNNLQELSLFGNILTISPGVFIGLTKLKQLRMSTKQKTIDYGIFVVDPIFWTVK